MKAITPGPLAAIRAIVLPLACCLNTSQAAVTLNADDTFSLSPTATGDLTLTGDLGVMKGIDFGMTTTSPALAAVQLNYFGGTVNSAVSDLTTPLGTFLWRDNLVATARKKLQLDGANNLTLYKYDGTTTGILLNPNTSQITLPATGGGIYAGATPVFTIDVTGKLVFGNRPFTMPGTTPATSSTTGALTVAGGLGVAMDSYFNGIRAGRGGGNVASNTAYGAAALNNNTTGYYNTATGYYALGANTTGSLNTADGCYALGTNTTGFYNTAAGFYSLRSNSTGYYNTANGGLSLYGNSSGFCNSAVGFQTLQNNTTGSNNVAAGYTANYYNTTGSNNTAAGSNSLYFNTTGSSNVAIGANAGKYQANGASYLADPENSIYLGANSRGFSNLDQNSIVIGFGAVGEGANTTVIGNSSTLTTHLYGQVDVSALTINHSPVLTRSSGTASVLTNGAILALGESASATQPNAIAIGYFAQAGAYGSVALGTGANCSDVAYNSIAMSGGQATNSCSMATSYGTANGYMSMACQTGAAEGASSIAIGGYDTYYGNWPGNHSTGDNSTTLGGVGNQALGFASYASGFWTKAMSAHALALGSLNCGLGTDASNWVETDPLLELGNGTAPRSWEEPASSNRSNAITTLKNGRTTLTNKAWLAHPAAPLADPPDSDSDSGGEALVVEGHTRLKGKVIIEQVQGDISMGIYGP